MMVDLVVLSYSTSSEGWVRERILRKPNIRATPQGLDQKSKIEEVVPKIAPRRGLDAGQYRKSLCSYVRKRCKKNSLSVLSCISRRTKEECDRSSEVGTIHSGLGE